MDSTTKLVIFGFAVLVGLQLSPLKGMGQTEDTVRLSMQEFIKRGLENAGKIEFEEQKTRLAELDVKKAKDQRLLPRIELSTQHGLIPGVESDSLLPNGNALPEGQYYLDPNLENNWEDWAVFTRAEIEAVQPIFTWGAIDNAIKAARAGARASREELNKQQADLRLRLFELYQSRLMIMEVQRLLEKAENQIDRIEDRIEDWEEDQENEVDQSDIYKFRVYKSRFQIRAAEVKQEGDFIRRTWREVLHTGDSIRYEPTDRFLDPVAAKIREIQYYKKQAMESRYELQRIEAGIQAAKYGVEAQKSQALPSLFLGLTASYANTPNRPRQENPFIINNTNYATAGFGLGIRQNLNFNEINNKVERQKVQYKQARSLKRAATEGIKIEINEKYKEASLSEAKMKYTDEALLTSKKWLQQEQLDYDLGMGEVKDLLESLKTKLEMEVDMKRRIFQFNKDVAELYHSAGLPLNGVAADS